MLNARNIVFAVKPAAMAWLALLLATPAAWAQPLRTPELRLAVLMHRDPKTVWTDEEMERIKEIGFNEVDVEASGGNWGDWTTLAEDAREGYTPPAGIILPGE